MPDPNNIIFHKHKIIYFAICKIASQSIRHAFMRALRLHKGLPAKVFNKRWTCDKYKAMKPEFEDYFKFTFVRNPFDRLVSCWFDKSQREKMFNPFTRYGLYHKMPFGEFVKIVCNMPDNRANQHWRRQTYDLMIDDKILVPEFVGRYERLHEDWKVIQERVSGLPDLPHANKADHKPYQEYYTPEIQDIVSHRYAQDLKVLNYTF